MASAGPLFWRALAAFLLLPGVVAFIVPWLLRPPGARLHGPGLGIVVAGAALLLRCVRDFYVAGTWVWIAESDVDALYAELGSLGADLRAGEPFGPWRDGAGHRWLPSPDGGWRPAD